MDDIDYEIKRSVNEGNNLEYTKELIAAKFKFELSELPRYDLLIIEGKYVKCLASSWLAKAPEEVVNHINNKYISEFIKKLNLVKTFVDCNKLLFTVCGHKPNYLSSKLFKYSFQLNELCDNSQILLYKNTILKSEEKNNVNLFKIHCCHLLRSKCEHIKNEQNFFDLLLNLLKSSKSPDKVCQSIGILPNVINFENALNFKEILQNIIESQSTVDCFVKVQQSAKQIINKEDLFFKKDIQEIIISYLDPTVVAKKNIDGRVILEVSGKHIVVSKMKREIEAMLKRFHEIEEVRFVNANVIHVDTDFSAGIWHGKNIVLYAETVIISEDKKIIWDVSGKDAVVNINSSETPSGVDRFGLPGADGRHGESGGNILIMVNVLRNGHNFTVKSNGGNGSNGQDGRKGEDGIDGFYFLDKESFNQEFPPVSKFKNSKKKENLVITKNSILRNFKCLEEFFVGKTDFGPKSKTDFETILSQQISDLNSFYFKVRTNDGCKITFSFYRGGICQSFLLHEGSLGSEGKLGGVGGKKGLEGHAGEINIYSLDSTITVLGDDGEEGLPGKPGPSGNPGKAGLDRAYKDCSVSIYNTWPKWVIPHDYESNKLKVIYHKEDSSERVYCPHNDLNADIKPRENEIKKVNRYSGDMKLTNEMHDNLKTHVQRKKAICEKSIKEQYPQKLNSVELFNLSNSIEEAEATLRSNNYFEKTNESDHVTTSFKIIKEIRNTYFEKNLDNYQISTSEHLFDDNIINASNNSLDGSSVVEVIEHIKRDPSEISNWTPMLKTRLDISQLQELWETASTCKQLLTEEYNEHFKIGFCNKYQLAVLEHLGDIIENSDYRNTYKNDPVDIPVNSFDKFFTIFKEEKMPTSDLEQLLRRDSLEDRQFILDKFKELLRNFNDNKQILNEILIIFLSEFSSFSNSTLKIQENVNAFRESNEQLLSAVLDAFKSALWREKDESIFNYLYKGVIEKSHLSLAMFENKVQRDQFLSALYNCYVRTLKEPYGWACISGSSSEIDQITACLCEYLLDFGPLSVCYRELLAYIFKTNILVYSISEGNKVTLAHNHNPRAGTFKYFLLKENRFVCLRLNNNLIELYNYQKTQSRLLNDIFIHIDSFTEKEQFDTFVSNCQTSLDLLEYVNIRNSLRIRTRLINISMEENNIREILRSYDLVSEKSLELSHRLEKLKYEYTGCETILHILALHFQWEGNHISAKELMYVINFVLNCALTVHHVIPIVSWVLATKSQNQWLVEIILLKLELHFQKSLDKKTKCLWRGHLSKKNDKNVLMLLIETICEKKLDFTEKQFEETIYLLSNISQAHVGLDELDFPEWKYYLKSKFWAHKLMEVAEWSNDDLNSGSYYLVVLENLVGLELCEKLVEVLKEHKSELKSESSIPIVPNLFCVMTNKDVCLNDSLLKLFKTNNVSDWVNIIEEKCFSRDKERSVDALVELIQHSGNTSDDVEKDLGEIAKAVKLTNHVIKTKYQEESKLKKGNNLSQVKASTLISELKNYFEKKKITDNTFTELGKALMKIYCGDNIYGVSKPTKELKSSVSLVPNQMLETLFATVVRAVEIKHTITLRDAQKLAIMTMLKSKNNILSQVSTGEGKSFIIVIFAIVTVIMKKQKVDIITSSRILAERDANDNKDIYNLFGINVGHNCSEDIEERRQVYSNNNIVYGELANFQRDYLLDHVYNKAIIGNSSFNTIIVDEVDSMLLDKGNNTLYLSHEIPGLDKLESVFIFIWKFLHIPSESIQPKLEVIVSLLKNRILHDVCGIVSKEYFKCLDTTLSDEIVNNTWSFLEREGFIDNSGKVLKQFSEDQFGTVPENCIHKHHLMYIFKKLNEREQSLKVPNYLKQYVEENLEEWVTSGVRAVTMEPGVDYVVDIDRSESICDRSPNIMIVDQDTGTDLNNSQWENGLHQFLQLKHGCRLSLMSLKAVFISNVSYLKKYTRLYGLTGTLGSEVERELLKETYKVDFVTIPTAKTKLFTEELPIVCSSRVEWYNKICEEVKNKLHRSVLIVCETVNDVLSLKKIMFKVLNKDIVKNIHTYTRDHEDFIIAKDLLPGHIIISTNLAGRGTDIRLSKKLIKAGGLHVCLSYLPRNSRIEEQAFGRAARNGQPGSGRIIFQHCSQKNALTIIHFKQQRDINEVFRIGDIKDYHKAHIEIEENCLKKFLDAYTLIKKSSHPKYIKSILLQVSLDQWAFWLEKKSNFLDTKSLENFIAKISKLKEQNFNEWSIIIEDPFHLIKLGLTLADKKQYDDAITLFNQVIEKEPLFSEGAQYYRLYVKSKQENLSKEAITEEMNIVAKQLTERINVTSLAAYTVDFLKNKNASLLQIESFKEQQLNIGKINSVFLQSIRNVVGHEISLEEFILPTYMDEETASIVFNELVKSGVIEKQKMKNCISEKYFPFAVKYGTLPEELSSILKEYENKIFDENNVLGKLEQTYPLPSRELFWSLLISKEILIDEQTFCLIDMNKLFHVDPSLVNIVNQLKETYMEQKNEMWMYQPNEIGNFEHNCAFLKKEILIRNIGEFKYLQLLNKSIIYLNKLATLQILSDDVQFDQFDSLKKEDFLKIGISLDTASNIIFELEEQCIIEQNKIKGEYMLLADGNDLVNFELSRFKAYTSDVVQLLNVCFSFKIAWEKLCHCKAKQMGNSKKLYISLPIRPHQKIINDLYEHEIVSKYFVNPKVDISKELNKLYPKAMDKEKCKNLFTDLYDKCTANSIIEHLINNKILVEKYTKSGLYSIKMDQVEKLSEYPYTETVKLILNRQFDLRENKDDRKMKGHIEDILISHVNMLYNVETPTFSLKHLSNVLKEYKLPLSECGIFSLNGFENILVLEEKKHTTKMMVFASGVAVLGLAEIAAGAAVSLLTLSTVAGAALISEGIGDIIYSMSCFYSGHFSWKSYAINKSISLVISACCFLRPIEYFQSIFGKNLSSQSSSSFMSSAKNTCSKYFQKTKTYLSSFFKTTPAPTIDSAVVVRTLAKQVATQTAVGCSIGLTYVGVDSILEPQLKSLGEELMERTLGDIDEIDGHDTIKHIKDIYKFLDKDAATKIIHKCFSEVLDEYKVKNQNDWTVLSHKLITTINNDFLNRVQQLKIKKTSIADSDAMILMMIEIIKKLNDIINSSQKLLPNSIISKIMDSMEQTFKKKLAELKTGKGRSRSDCEVKRCISKVIDDLKDRIKSVLAQNIHLSIIIPVLSILKTKSGEYLMKMGSEKCLLYKEKGLSELIEDNKQKYKKTEFWQAEKSEYSSQENWSHMYYNECLMELFKRKRSIPVYLEILNSCSSVDESFIELCCSVIPLILRQEGFNVPMLRIVIEYNDMQYIYGGNVGSETSVLTINVTPDETFVTNLKQNKILIRNVLDTTYKTIIKHCPEYKGLTSEMLHKIIINAVENNLYVQEYIKTGSTATINIADLNNGNTNVYNSNNQKEEVTKKITEDANGQNVKVNSKLTAVLTADTKVHEIKTHSQSQVVKIQVSQVFKTALAKINHHLQLTQPHFKHFKITLGDFDEIRHVIISSNTLGRYFDSYATGYGLIVPLMEPDGKMFFDCNVTMSLNDRCINTHLHDSVGPRIEYAIRPVKILQSKHFDSCVKGHILLDFEYKYVDNIYSINQCHSAGELVLPRIKIKNFNRKETRRRSKKKGLSRNKRKGRNVINA